MANFRFLTLPVTHSYLKLQKVVKKRNPYQFKSHFSNPVSLFPVSGPYCTQDVDECQSSTPCQNGATCHNIAGDYKCVCVNGWTGKDCTINVDDCANHPCYNGGTCHDRVGYYQCECPPGKTGECHMLGC